MLIYMLDDFLLCFEKPYRVARFHLRNPLQDQMRHMLNITQRYLEGFLYYIKKHSIPYSSTSLAALSYFSFEMGIYYFPV